MSNAKPWFKKKQPSINPKTQAVASTLDNSPKNGYRGLKLYFPDEDAINLDETIQHVKVFEKFLDRNLSKFEFSTIAQEKRFTVDYKLLFSDDDDISIEWRNLKNDIVSNTDYCLNCMGLAMHQTVLNDLLKQCDGEVDSFDSKLGLIRARLINYEPSILLRDIKVNYYGKLVSIKGTVIKAGNVKLIGQYMTFKCSSCTGLQLVEQIEGCFTLPNKCVTKGCRAQSNFQALHDSEHTRTTDGQSIKIQELVGSDDHEEGRVPRTLDCELTDDLVRSCVPGDDVTIIGVLKVQSNEMNSKNKPNSIFHLYVNVISVVNNKNHNDGSYGASERITFNVDDYDAIRKIHNEANLFRYLVQSLCPNIYGHEVIKAGLLLALFGGTKSDKMRAESHVLMMGDPGLGKSQMLHSCTNVAPRGVYVCGNTSTGSGLTVTMTRESGGGCAMEAGALLLADQGCCCIDEFDKMSKQHFSLLEAMEQQTISIAKAGMVCTLPARTTILAAANPVGGHYNKAKTVAENLKISSPMLSRFDLIFIILDQPNEDLDKMLTKHVLAKHCGKKTDVSLNLNATTTDANSTAFKDRLKIPANEIQTIDFLPHSLFRKYIAYAQKYVNPQLSDEAKQVLKEFYLKLRKQFRTGDCTPVTTRQLNSLIRLTQARAKLELREQATREDAMDVVEIMQLSLVDIFSDGTGAFDLTRSQNGTGMSSRNKCVKLLRLLQKRSENQGTSIFTTIEIREVCEAAGISRDKLYDTIDRLNIQGFLLSKGGNKYQLVCTDL